MIKNLIEKYLNNNLEKKLDHIEHLEIRRYLSGISDSHNLKLVDLGSGMCEMAEYFRELLPSADITCVDINNDLVELAISKGFRASSVNITKMPFEDNYYDVVHCSHVIEHIGYPDITLALDEMMRIIKPGGICIIRSPLIINHRFYNDIDHVSPYPPAALLNYFNYTRQQKKSIYKVTELGRWYTKIFYEIDYYKHTGFAIKYINLILKIFWVAFGLPRARPNNYGIVLMKDINESGN